MLLRYLVAAQQVPGELPSPFTGPSTQSTGDAGLGCSTSSAGDHILWDSSSSPQILPLQHLHLESQTALQEDVTEREEKQDGPRESAGGRKLTVRERKELERSSNMSIPRGKRRGWRFSLHPRAEGDHPETWSQPWAQETLSSAEPGRQTPLEGRGWQDTKQLRTRGEQRDQGAEARPQRRCKGNRSQIWSLPRCGVHKEQISCQPARASSRVSRSLCCCPQLGARPLPPLAPPPAPAERALPLKAAPASSRNNSGEEERFHKEDLFWRHRN